MGIQEVSQKQNIGITFCFFTFSTFLAIVYPDIVKVAGIIGGFCAVTQAYVLPLLMFRKLRENEQKEVSDWVNLIIGVVVAIMGYTTTILIIAANFYPGIEKI